MKDNATWNGKKYLQMKIPTGIHLQNKEPHTAQYQKHNNPRHKWAKHRDAHFLEEDIQIVIRHVITCSDNSFWHKGKSKVQWEITSPWSRQPSQNTYKKICLLHWHGEGNGTPLQHSCLENPMDGRAWWAAVHGVSRSQTRLSDFTFTFHFHALEKEMATHSSVLAWRIPGTVEPSGLPSMESHRVRHDWSDLAAAAALADRVFFTISTTWAALFQYKKAMKVQKKVEKKESGAKRNAAALWPYW